MTTTEPPRPPRRGRPRSRQTLERDEAVYDVLRASLTTLTRRNLEIELGWHGRVVYPCLVRLRRAGRIEKVNGNNYRAAAGAE